jgi:hypothetical protein
MSKVKIKIMPAKLVKTNATVHTVSYSTLPLSPNEKIRVCQLFALVLKNAQHIQ